MKHPIAKAGPRRTGALGRVITVCAGIALVAVVATAVPDEPKSTQRAPSAQSQPRQLDADQNRRKVAIEIRIDPESLRQRLNRSIMRSQQVLDRSKAALEKLDAGAPAIEVLEEMRFEGISRSGPGEGGQHSPRVREVASAGDAPGHNEIFSPEERKQLHDFLAEYFPSLWANLTPFVEQDPHSADQLLSKMAPQIREILFLRRTQPELATIKISQMRIGLDFVEASRVYRLALNAPDASEQDKAKAYDTLLRLASERFDMDLRAKQFEVDRLESRLDELRASIEEIQSRRDTEVQHMVNTATMNARRQSRPRSTQKDG